MSEPRASRPGLSRLLTVLLGPLLPWFRLLGLARPDENHYWHNAE